MELRHLHAFVTVAEERHFGRAAQRLGISQPPLSRQIQQLEGELGLRLFHRNARSVELTTAGASYLAAIRPHLDGLAHAADAAQSTHRQPRGKLKAGFVSSLAYGLMPRLLETLRAVAPGVSVELFEQSSAAQCRALRESRLDIGFVFLPVEDQDLTMRRLFREPLVAMLPVAHPLAALPMVALERLHGEPFILCSRQSQTGFHEVVLDLCRATGFVPRLVHGASSTATMAELVAAGLGVALVPQSATGQGHAGVIYKTLASTPLVLEIAAVWRAEAMTPVLRLFLDHGIRAARGPQFDAASEKREDHGLASTGSTIPDACAPAR